MKPLIDADVLRYEIGFSGEYKDEDGENQIREFEFVADLFDQKIKEICVETWATESPLLFLTMDNRLHKRQNRDRKKIITKLLSGADEASAKKQEKIKQKVAEIEKDMEYVPNFRDKIATKKPYKGNRKSNKPFHYDNLTQHILNNYECMVAKGYEADDLMSIYQCQYLKEMDTIICSRDKDLRITPGMHYGWPCGRQPQFGPKRVTEVGELELKPKKVVGDGLMFFYSQLITGDTVDNIPGLPRGGPVKAFNTLHGLTSEEEMFNAVAALYEASYGDTWREEMEEQANLLWMVREFDEEGNIVPYVMFDERVPE